jgi:TIR domain
MSDRPYCIVVLGTDAEWAAEVAARCVQDLAGLVERADLVDMQRALAAHIDPAEAPPQTLVLFLADDDSRDDEDLMRQIEDARARLIPVLPLVQPGADVSKTLPEILRALNAIEWDRGGRHAVGEVARLLGLAEADRRLFLSYRRLDASSLALQLREQLSRRTFDVFLDRFSVPPAADFQRRIDTELGDKAFVLLLESPAASKSAWVEHEVAYAIAHAISLLALSMPETTKKQRFQTVDDAFRMPINDNDLEKAADPVGPDDRVLKKECLEEVLDAIEAEHARRMRQRRTSLLGSLRQWLTQAGRNPEPLSEQWALRAHDPDAVFMITPGAPLPRDLRRLDELRAKLPDGADGRLFFAAPMLDEHDERLIEWIVKGRALRASPYLDAPKLLGI